MRDITKDVITKQELVKTEHITVDGVTVNVEWYKNTWESGRVNYTRATVHAPIDFPSSQISIMEDIPS